MPIFSGIFNAEETSIFDEEQSLTLSCPETLAAHFHIRDEEIVGGEFLVTTDGSNVLTSIRTINLENSSTVRNRRAPSSNLWWNPEAVSEHPFDEEDSDETPEDFSENMTEERSRELRAESRARIFNGVGSGISNLYRASQTASENVEVSIPSRTPADDEVADSAIRIRHSSDTENPLQGYADMVNRSMDMENEWTLRARRSESEERTVRSGFFEAVEASDRAVRSTNPQRRPNIRRGGRRQW